MLRFVAVPKSVITDTQTQSIADVVGDSLEFITQSQHFKKADGYVYFYVLFFLRL
jgi:hypothetical protein